MRLLLEIVLLVIGFALLIKGADAFVDGASEVSRRLKIPPVIVGLTVVAFGTSLPEFAVSISAAISGNNGIAAGNVVGSNIFNLLMVAGLSALFMKLPVSETIVKKDYPFMLAVTIALFGLFMDGSGLMDIMTSEGAYLPSPYGPQPTSRLSQGDGLVLLVFFVIFLVYTIRGAIQSRASSADEPGKKSMGGFTCVLFIVLGVVGIAVGGNLVVNSATEIALAFGMSETLIGLTIVALGTSLPELVTSVVAARKGENDICIGNVVGSNLFNICFVLGLSTAIHPIAIDGDIVIDTLIFLGASIVFVVPIIKNRSLGKLSGALMVLTYGAYLAYIIMRNYGIVNFL